MEFKHVDISEGEAGLLEKLGDGISRAEQQLFLGVLSNINVVAKERTWFEAAGFGFFFTHDEAGRGTVGEVG